MCHTERPSPRARPRQRLRWSVVVPLLLGCSVTRAPGPLPRPSSADPAALLAHVREQESHIQSLRARFSADSVRDGTHQVTDGVLLVKKPDRFRLRLMLTFGLTVFDYVSWGERVSVSLPLQVRADGDHPADPPVPFAREDLDQAFLRGPHAFPGTCLPNRNDAADIAVVCRDAAGRVLRRIEIDARTGLVREETSYAAEQPRLVLRFDDYRQVDNMYLPHSIVMIYPERKLSVAISIRRYEVNPQLADALFEPPPSGSGS